MASCHTHAAIVTIHAPIISTYSISRVRGYGRMPYPPKNTTAIISKMPYPPKNV